LEIVGSRSGWLPSLEISARNLAQVQALWRPRHRLPARGWNFCEDSTRSSTSSKVKRPRKLDVIGCRIEDLTYDFLTTELTTTAASQRTTLHKRLDKNSNGKHDIGPDLWLMIFWQLTTDTLRKSHKPKWQAFVLFGNFSDNSLS